MEEIIRTSRNGTYKHIKSLLQKKMRCRYGEYIVEGLKSVSDAAAAGADISVVAVSESFLAEQEWEIPRARRRVTVADGLFNALCDTKTPQGILAVVRMRTTPKEAADPSKLYVYCDGIADPGNLGTIIRTADAAAFGGVLLSPGCAELFAPKVVRASMGSFFHTSVAIDVTYDDLESLKARGFELYSGVLSDESERYTAVDFTGPSVIVIGNEANGVSERIRAISRHIMIPIPGQAESLNAAVAAAIIMYEAVRQRDEKR